MKQYYFIRYKYFKGIDSVVETYEVVSTVDYFVDNPDDLLIQFMKEQESLCREVVDILQFNKL